MNIDHNVLQWIAIAVLIARFEYVHLKFRTWCEFNFTNIAGFFRLLMEGAKGLKDYPKERTSE